MDINIHHFLGLSTVETLHDMRSVLNDSDGMQQRSQQGSVAQHQHRQDHGLDDGSLKQEVDVGSGGSQQGSSLALILTHLARLDWSAHWESASPSTAGHRQGAAFTQQRHGCNKSSSFIRADLHLVTQTCLCTSRRILRAASQAR